MPLSRRQFLIGSAAAGTSLFLVSFAGGTRIVRAVPISNALLDPGDIGKFMSPLLIPPVMPRSGVINPKGGKPIDYYEISMRQFAQQILPAGMPATPVWGYGAVSSASSRGLLLHNAPSLTIEAQWKRPVRVKWINDLVDGDGDYLPHLLAVDPTLHWANPPGGDGRARHPPDLRSDAGPVHRPGPDGHPRPWCGRCR